MRYYLIILIFCLFPKLFSQVVINEVIYENRNGLTDPEGKTSDWLELYNSGQDTVNLRNWSLSDDPENIRKWQFPHKIMLPGEYLLVFASGNNKGDDTLHTNFKLQWMEDPLILSDSEGVIYDYFEPRCIPADHTAMRVPDGSDIWVITNSPTPGSSNNMSTPVSLNYKADSLSFSHVGGFYQESIDIALTNSRPGNTIYYTTDSREPDNRSLLYSDYLTVTDRSNDPNYFSEIETSESYRKPEANVFKATVIRAVVFSEGCPASEIVSQTFFVHPEMRSRYHVPVVSVIAEPDDFFSDETGIYVKGDHDNYLQRGEEWEREIHLQIFDTTGTILIDQNAGARIHGRGTRFSAQKSLRLYADDKYGKSEFAYPLFPDRPNDSYRRLLLRTSRGDWNGALFTDLLCHELVKDMNVDYMSGITNIVFINGEYWGIQNLRERQDEAYILSHYPFADSGFDIIDYVQGSGPEVESGSIDNYETLVNILMNGHLSDEELYCQANKMIDLDNMIDYFIAEMYLANVDFPDINQTLWRPALESEQWRWFFFDCDGCFFRNNYDHLFDYYNEFESYDRHPAWSMVILSRLLRNQVFREQFMQRFFWAVNTVFSPEKVIRKIDSLKAIYMPLIPEHIERWNTPSDMNSWLYNVEGLKEFAVTRPPEITDQLFKYFGSPVMMYPNPVSDRVNLKSELFLSENTVIRIFDLSGREVVNFRGNKGTEEIGIELDSGLHDGIYIMNLQVGYLVLSQKLVIRNE